MSKEDIVNYVRRNYKTPNIAILETLGATDELIEYLIDTPNNTNIKIVDGLIGGGSEDDKPGIKSITFSPAIATTPTLSSIFPYYWDEEQAEDGIIEFKQKLTTLTDLTEGAKYTVTITPTSEWAVGGPSSLYSEAGQPLTYEVTVVRGALRINAWVGTAEGTAGFTVQLTITVEK